MNRNLRNWGAILLVLTMAVMLFSACGSTTKNETAPKTTAQQEGIPAQTTEEKPQDVKLTYLNNWNGSGVIAPTDPINNPVAKVLKEKTGVTIEAEYATTSESEKLNLVFASGNMPDIINTAFWGGADATTQTLKKAGKEGQLIALDDLLDKYGPHLKPALSEGVARDFREYDLEDPVFGGKHYILPWQTSRTEKDITNWAYGVYARKDILEALKVKPSDIKNSDDIYILLKNIKNGGFKDINGKPVIPAGSWANGWPLDCLYNSYREVCFTDYRKADGKFTFYAFSPLMDKQVLYMRKLVNEGLLDPEAFRQNDTIAKEKLATGRIAVLPSMYQTNKDFFTNTLYASHPEMQYVPLGPVVDGAGQPVMSNQVQLKGRAGTPCLVLTKNCKNAEAAIKFIDYINSDEGLKLVYYGIEGIHYSLVDGKPRMNKEWLEKYGKDPKLLRDEGIQSIFSWMVTLDPRMSMFGEMNPGDSDKQDEVYESIKAMYPLKFVDGFRVSYFKYGYPEYEKIDSLTSYDKARDAIEKAYFAKTDASALEILNDYRDQLKKGGIEDFEKYLNEKAATRNDVIY